MTVRTRLFVFLLCISLVSLFAFGQEFRATVTGVVTDSTNAAVPNATVTVHNLDTNQSTVVKTNATGNYTVPFLRPGQRYEVSVEAPGFKKATYPPVTVTIGQVVNANVQLQVGGASEQVTVTSEAPMLELSKADRGGLVDNKTIKELPLNGRNPLSLATMVAGVTFQGGEGFQPSPWDTYGGSMFSVNGGKNMNNEFLLDGMPNNAYVWYGNGVSSVPSVDAVQEFKIVTNPYDAQYGRTAGGVINMSLKSGGNQLHGSVYEYARRTWLDANDWWNNANGYERSEHKEDQYGFQVDGPVYIPKVYDGRNKTFFMFNMERFRKTTPAVRTFMVPDPAWLKGDFSNLKDSNGNLIKIYDPSTANAENGYTRSTFPNNQIPLERLSPIALKLLSYFPAPNYTDPYSEPWQRWWNDPKQVETDQYDAYIAKIDQNIGNNDRMFFNFTRSTEEWWSWWGPTDMPYSNGSLPYKQLNTTGGFDWVHTFNSNLLLNLHSNFQRYYRTDQVAAAKGFDITQLGFSKALADQIPLKKFPMVVPSGDYMNLTRNYYLMPNDSYSIAPSLTWVKGKHTIKTGLDFRITHYAELTNWTGGMRLDFDGSATREFFDNWGSSDDANDSGNVIADMLLGIPNNASVDYKMTPYYSWHYYAPWFQDDWKVTDKLTVNLGFRWDLNGPISERYNRISYGFDATAVNPVNDQIPISQRAGSCMNMTVNGQVQCVPYPNVGTVYGGMKFAGVNGNPRSPYRFDKNNLQPRAGFAYQITPKTVVRGGFGFMYMNPIDTGNIYGFSYTTPYVRSLDGNRTFLPNLLANPFPDGLVIPPGASQGLATNDGSSFYYRQEHYQIPWVNQFSFGVQRELPKNASVEISYVGSRSYDQETTFDNVNAYPLALRKSCDYTQPGGNRNNCIGLVPNPFYGTPAMAGTAFGKSPTYAVSQFARPYPEFTSIGARLLNGGKYWYNSVQATYKQHLSWLDLNATYTYSKNMQSGGYVDEWAMTPLRVISDMDRKHRFTMSSVFQIPVGRDRKLFSGMSKWLDRLVGGWELGSGLVAQTGLPWNLPTGSEIIGDIHGAKGDDPNLIYAGINTCGLRWSKPNDPTGSWVPTKYSEPGCTPAWRMREGYEFRTTQPRTDLIRQPGYLLLDTNLGKTVKLTERVNMQFRLECFNTLNHANWNQQYDSNVNGPMFGVINKLDSGAATPARQVQLGAKVTW